MKRLAIFASGNGSNFQAIINATKTGALHATIALLVCDRDDAYAIYRAKRNRIPTFVFSPAAYSNKAAYEQHILSKLQEYDIDFIVLAGYMRLIGEILLQPYEGRIVNIHPSLLPSFPGKDAIGQALKAGVSTTGVTIHFVDRGMDTGPIIYQKQVPISSSDTRQSLQKKIQKLEHQLYPMIIQKLVNHSYS